MSQTTRRRFAQLCGAAVAAPLVMTREAAAQAAAAEVPEVRPLGQALTGVIRAQWGQHLTAEQLAKIADDMNDAVSYVERLRKFELRNSDEPDVSFSAISR